MAVGLIVILVGALMRSSWASAVVASALGATLLLYNGTLGLLGVKMTSQLILFVVPITLIAFGVDFFVHAAGRVREVQGEGRPLSVAYTVGMVAVLPALTLAAATSIAAFLSNAASGIEAIVQFGLAASVGLVISYVALGWLAPRAMVGIERWVGPRAPGRTPSAARMAATVVAFALTATVAGGVVTMAALAPSIGVLALPLFVGLFVAAPAVVGRRRRRRRAPVVDCDGEVSPTAVGHGSRRIGSIMALATRWRYLMLAVFAVLGGVGLAGATRVESAFEVSDFFSRKRTSSSASTDSADTTATRSVALPTSTSRVTSPARRPSTQWRRPRAVWRRAMRPSPAILTVS